MADSSVPITPGVGANVDTRTESVAGDHRQVVVIGDPADGNRVVGVGATGLSVDIDQSGMLTLILQEIRKTNLYLALLTDEDDITDDDIGELES